MLVEECAQVGSVGKRSEISVNGRVNTLQENIQGNAISNANHDNSDNHTNS